MKLSEFKIGNVVVIIKHLDKIKMSQRFPVGLITEVRVAGHNQDRYDNTIKALNSKSTWTSISNLKLLYRPATEREAFLYHIMGKPFVLREK